jgi:hypothetical protein
MIAYQGGARAVTFQRGRVVAMFVSFTGAKRMTLAQAQAAIGALLPPDRTAIGTLSAGPNRVAELYQSARLAAKVAPVSPTTQPGQFAVVFESDGTASIGSALLIIGDIPKTR